MLILLIYLASGIIVNLLYRGRDIKLTGRSVQLAFMNEELEQKRKKVSGYCFWRMRKPFVSLPQWLKTVIGTIFWPVDLVLTEIGYKKEYNFLKGEYCKAKDAKEKRK